jgi:ABC-type microcin C transport system duplicated ATPase subunit YejF
MLEVTGSMDALMELRQAEKAHRVQGQWVRSLAPLDLSVAMGQAVGVVGESGAGKTTIGWLMLGLLEPTRGQVLYRGIDIATMRGGTYRNWRRRVQAVFQNPSGSLNPRMRVRDIVTEPLRVHRPRGQAIDVVACAARMLAQVQLDGKIMDRYPHQISGGQQQRVAIARALALEPEFLVLDEPVSALDMSTRGDIIRLLRDIKRERGVALLYISHDLETVAALCDEVLILKNGIVQERGIVDALAYLPSSPYGRELYEAANLAVCRERALQMTSSVTSQRRPA